MLNERRMDALEMVYRLLSAKSALYLTWLFKSLSRVQLFVTPWIVARQAPLSLELSRQEYWSGLPFPPPGDRSNPEIKYTSPAWHVDSLPLRLPPGKPILSNEFHQHLLSAKVTAGGQLGDLPSSLSAWLNPQDPQGPWRNCQNPQV